MRKLIPTVLLLLSVLALNAVEVASDSMKITVNDAGHITQMETVVGTTRHVIPFRKDKWSGPSFYFRNLSDKELVPKLAPVAEGSGAKFAGTLNGLYFELNYQAEKEGISVKAQIRNDRKDAFIPQTAGIRLGLDCYQAKFPDWNDDLMPNVMRCEPTHHWGFAMSPAGTVLGWVTDAPVASYSINYEPKQHRVYTANIDFLNALPLPARHPQNLSSLAPGKSLSWTILLLPLRDELEASARLAQAGSVPVFSAERYTVAPGDSTEIRIYGPALKSLVYTDSDDRTVEVGNGERAENETRCRFVPKAPGLYTFRATAENGKICEGTIFVRQPWSWYLINARKEGLRVQPTETHHAECVYPFYSYYLARQHFPDAKLDAECEAVFQKYFPLHYDFSKKQLRTTFRIQDTATWAGILAARYHVTQDAKDLELAATLVDFLVDKCQGADGAYRIGQKKGTHYTSVIYLAKSIMEVMAEIRPLAQKDAVWQARYEKYDASVKRAIDDLARRLDNIETEGQMTYEDGMISCSMLQLGLFALTHPEIDPKPYVDTARHHAMGHRSLTLSAHPDARVNGSTIRFWETQYTICLMANMYNSPCGWSAWKLYADYYFYLLTGEERWLSEMFNGMGACVQLMDWKTGRLRWGFTPDPYVKTRWAIPATHPDDKKEHDWKNGIIGEQYLEMISDWNRTKPVWREKWGIDNFPHEVFKCMEECVMLNAFVVERPDGSVIGYNCTVKREMDGIVITGLESTIRRVHLNLRKSTNFKVNFNDGIETAGTAVASTMRWVEHP